MNLPQENTMATPTFAAVLTFSTSHVRFEPYLASRTSSSSSPTFTGSDDYPVFPNGNYISKFYLVSSGDSGLTNLDIDLYNACYLPHNPLPYEDNRKRNYGDRADPNESSPSSSNAPRPTYQINEAPCKRQASVNANCYFENTNKTLSGLLPYSGKWDVQQQCYCEKYPFFDSVMGCMECFRQHGGIAGYHWFPESYVSAISSSYCAADPQTTGLYGFASDWAKTDPAAVVSRTTASNVLGTQTDFSLYYTYAAAKTSSPSGAANKHSKSWMALFAALTLSVMLCQ